MVSGVNFSDNGEVDQISKVCTTNDPKQAIDKWFRLAPKYPTTVNLMAKHKDDAIKLIKYAADNEDWIKEIYSAYGRNPYKLEFLIDAINKQNKNKCNTFYDNKYGYGDQVHPFDVG